MQLWHKAGKNFRHAFLSVSKRGLKLCYQEEGRLAIASESQIRSNLITISGIGLIGIGGMAKVQNQGESRHRPIPFTSNPQKWVAMQLQVSFFIMQYVQEHKADKLYRLEKSQEGSGSQKNLEVLVFCPGWDICRSPELQRVMSSCLMNKNFYFEIHRWKLPKSKSFSNVLITI